MRSASFYTPLLLDGLVLTLEAIRAVQVEHFYCWSILSSLFSSTQVLD